MEHVGLQCPDPPVGWIAVPDIFGQPVHRDDPVRLQQQQGKNGPLPRPAQRHHVPGPGDFQRPEDAELDGHRFVGHRISSHLIPRPVASQPPGQAASTIPPPGRSQVHWCSKPPIQAVPKAIPAASRCHVRASTQPGGGISRSPPSLAAGQQQPR